MRIDDFDYLTSRAMAELDMAQRATLPRAVAAHYEIAKTYLERADALRPFSAARAPYPPALKVAETAS